MKRVDSTSKYTYGDKLKDFAFILNLMSLSLLAQCRHFPSTTSTLVGFKQDYCITMPNRKLIRFNPNFIKYFIQIENLGMKIC